MTNSSLTDIYQERRLPPVALSPSQEELCSRLDSFNQKTIDGLDLASIFRGALYAARKENRSNPDWMAQSAHSLREILYVFMNSKTPGKKYEGKWRNAFRVFGSATAEEDNLDTLVSLYGKITDIAHHQLVDIEEFNRLFDTYQKALSWALSRQVDVHKEIDAFFTE